MPSYRMRISAVVVLAILVGAFFTAEEVFIDLARGRPGATMEDLRSGLLFWGVWVLLAPAVLLALRRWPLGIRPAPRPLVVHAGIAVTLAVLHNLIAIAIAGVALSVRGGVTLGMALTQYASPVAFTAGVFTGVIFYTLILMVYSATALEAELTRAKLDTLRGQLRPHFLFNTLNAISVFLTEDVEKARQMLLRLSTLLRRSLDQEAHEVSLRQELAFLDDYLEIQRGRFGDRLVVRITAEPATLEARVPVFLLQPLLENAVEHGRSDDRPTTITLAATREHDLLHITLTDDGPGLGNGPPAEGVGLSNTRARLHHLYGARATVQLGAADGPAGATGVRVEIRIPFEESSR